MFLDRTLAIALIFVSALLSVPFVISFLNAYPYRIQVPLRPFEETWLQIHQVLPFDFLDAAAENDSGLLVRMSNELIMDEAIPAANIAGGSINLCHGNFDHRVIANGTVQLTWQSNSSVPLDIILNNERVNGSVDPEYGQMSLNTPLYTRYSSVNALSLTKQVFIFASTQTLEYRLRVQVVERPPECAQGLPVILWLDFVYNGVTGKFNPSSPVTELKFPLNQYRLPEGQKSAHLIIQNLRDESNSFTITVHLTTGAFIWNLLMSLLSGPVFGLYILVVLLCYPCGLLVQWLKSRTKRPLYLVLEEGESKQ